MNTLPIHLAPLQGYTEAAYRNAHAAVFGGVDVYHTPFVRIDRGEFRHKCTGYSSRKQPGSSPHSTTYSLRDGQNRANNRPFHRTRLSGDGH